MTDKLLGKVLGSSYDDDGFLGLQIEVFGSKSVGWFELSNPHGFQSRPLDPDESGFCQAYYWYEGSRGYCTLANDVRTQSQVSLQLQKGEAMLHHPLGAGFVKMGAAGNIALFTTDDGTPTGRTVFLDVSRKGLNFVFPYGKLTFDDTGFHLLHNSGARIDLGAVGGMTAPLNQLSSYVHIGAAIATVEGAAVKVGPRLGAAVPLATAPATLAVFAALDAAMVAMGAALAALSGITANGAASPAVAAAASAIGAASAAVAAAAAALPSLSTVSS